MAGQGWTGAAWWPSGLALLYHAEHIALGGKREGVKQTQTEHVCGLCHLAVKPEVPRLEGWKTRWREGASWNDSSGIRPCSDQPVDQSCEFGRGDPVMNAFQTSNLKLTLPLGLVPRLRLHAMTYVPPSLEDCIYYYIYLRLSKQAIIGLNMFLSVWKSWDSAFHSW